MRRHTDTLTKYRNPRSACAPRVNYSTVVQNPWRNIISICGGSCILCIHSTVFFLTSLSYSLLAFRNISLVLRTDLTLLDCSTCKHWLQCCANYALRSKDMLARFTVKQLHIVGIPSSTAYPTRSYDSKCKHQLTYFTTTMSSQWNRQHTGSK